jgi:DNA repair exonuclease SbcCD ATPase subunit
MKIEFSHLVIKDFKSFSGPQEINFEALGNGLHFFSGENKVNPALGSNGAGKSSVFDAITWCIYGRTAEGLRSTDICPRNPKGRPDVALGITINDHAHEIRRTWGPSSLTLNGNTIGQEEVERTIGLSLPTFCNTILFGQGQPLFYDLKPTEKMSLFSDVLNQDRWEQRAQRASEEASKIEGRISLVQADISGADMILKQLEDMIENEEDRKEEWDKKQGTFLESIERELKELGAQLEPQLKKLDEADLTYDNAETEHRALLKLVASTSEAWRKQLKVAQSAESQSKALKHDIERLTSELERFNIEGVCPTCGQELSTDTLRKHTRAIRQTNEDLVARAKVVSREQEKLTQLEMAVKKAESDRDEFARKAIAARGTLDSVRPSVERIKAEIKELKTRQQDYEHVANPHTKQLIDLNRRRTKFISKQREHQEELVTLEIQHGRTRFWVKGFKEIKLFIIDEVLDELEIVTNAMLEEVGLIDWSIQYDVERETKSGTIQRGLHVKILEPNSDATVRWESWSGGERQRLRLVGSLALAQVLLNHAGVETNFEILDEPSQHLSDEGLESLTDMLADRARILKRMIIYADHRIVESARFSSIVSIVREKDGSVILP